MLPGRKALITGGAKRIGLACAKALAQQRVDIVLHYNSSEKEATQSAEMLKSLGVDVFLLQADLSQPDVAETLFEKANQKCGAIDILVNNASIFPEDTLEQSNFSSMQTNFSINTYAPFAIAKSMAKSGSKGVVVNFLDTRVQDYDAGHFSYHVSKRSLLDLTRMMALDFAPDIRVNGIAPGLVLPPEGKDESYLESLSSTNPMNAVGDESDIVKALLFLIESDFVTGQIIYVDGGRHMKGNVYE